MFNYNDYIGFLLCIDLFSRKIFCRPIKSKSANSIQRAFNKIFAQCDDKPDVLETDRGSEFAGNRQYFKEQKIFLKFKTGLNKASFAENGILLVKRKLFRLMRSLLTKNWPKYLRLVVSSLNNTPNQAIGGLKPDIIQSRTDSELIDKKIGFHPDVPFEVQKESQKKYELSPRKLQVGSYVYVNFLPTPLGKSFDSPNYQLFIVSRVDAGKRPILYQVKDLMGTIQPGFFYREELLEGEKPKPNSFFRVEKILKKRKRKNKKEFLVKFLHYPAKFNMWLPQNNFVEK